MPTYENQPQGAPSRQPLASERLAQSGTLNQPIACEKCGGTYFYTVHAEQFAGGGYGSVEFRSVTPSPYPLRICLCGYPLMPKIQATGGAQQIQTARSQFVAALQIAQKLLKALTPEKLSEGAITKLDLEQLKEELGRDLDKLKEQLGTKPEAKEENVQPAAEPAPETPKQTTRKRG